MTNWKSLGAGLRLFRTLIIALVVTYITLFAFQVASSYELAVARGTGRTAADWAINRRQITAFIFFGVTLACDALAFLVGSRWRPAPADCRRRVRLYLFATAIAFILNGLAVATLLSGDSETAFILASVSAMAGWLKICFALSFLRGCLDALSNENGLLVTAVNWALPGCLLLYQVLDRAMLASPWAALGNTSLLPLLWLAFFLVCASRSLRAFDAAIQLDTNAFD